MLNLIILSFFAIASVSKAAPIGVIPSVALPPDDNPITPEKIKLGKQLFFDPRLSLTKTVSCNSCHLVNGEANSIPSGTDNLPTSNGINGLKGGRNSPTVWNSGLRSALFWDGRAKSLEEQAKGPLINPVEMGMPNHESVETIVQSISGYRDQFKKVFKSAYEKKKKVTITEIAQAIATYERTSMTVDSPFDRYQKGDKSALNEKAIRGWERFQSIGCISCHGAPTFTGQDFFVRFPIRSVSDADYLFDFNKDDGRYNATHLLRDQNLWRVPSLRNVAITAPYFHNGKVDLLEQAVRIMGRSQLNKTLSEDEIQDIVEYLKSLTGKTPVQILPKLPK